LIALAKTARILQGWSVLHGSAENYFVEVIRSVGGDPKRAALELGRVGGDWKLPGFGVPIAAEALRNLGFDLSKPDRHVCRAVGSFGLVEFRRWTDRSGTKAPSPRIEEMMKVMAAVESFARGVGVRATFLDNAIWLLCARSGCHLTNEELSALALPS
jgi:hypothetical protein